MKGALTTSDSASLQAARNDSITTGCSSLDLRDDRLGEPLEVLDLLRQRLRVGTLDVRQPEPDDHIGDPAVLEALAAVDGVRVQGDHVLLERLVRNSLLL